MKLAFPRQPGAILFLVVGLAFLAFNGWHTYHTATFLAHASRTSGVIVDPAGHPTIRFTTSTGRTVDFVQNGFVLRAAGAAIPVAYDAASPATVAQADTFWTDWGLTLWLLPIGLGFTILPLLGATAVVGPTRW